MSRSRAAMTDATALNRSELFESMELRGDIPALARPEEEVLPGVAGDSPEVMIATTSSAPARRPLGPVGPADGPRGSTGQ